MGITFNTHVKTALFLSKSYRCQTIIAGIVKSPSTGRPRRWVLVVHQALYIRDQNSKNNPLTVQELGNLRILRRCHVNINAAPNMGRVGPEVQVQLKTSKNKSV